MPEIMGKHMIRQLQKKWAIKLMLAYLLLMASAGILLTALAIALLHLSWWVLPVILIPVYALVFLFFYKSITEEEVSRFLNTNIPELQESAGLVLKPTEELSFLEQLQLQVITPVLEQPIREPKAIRRKITVAILAFLLSVLIAFLCQWISTRQVLTHQEQEVQKIKETVPAQVNSITVSINPPVYTGRHNREQDKLNLAVEEDGTVHWILGTNTEVKTVDFVFNDHEVLALTAADDRHTKWVATKKIISSGFYQLRIDGNPSELYRIEMIRDEAPVIAVVSPKPNTLIEPGQVAKVLLDLTLTDDYGIKNTIINATFASGNGEAVKFKTQQFSFPGFTPGGNKYQLQKQFDLAAMGMKGGDELYFYITATDTHDQVKRSDIYIVRIEDTAQLMSMNGLLSATNIKPEFFRSERQIIIETEQLLSGKDTMTTERFNERSNELGIDQKLLRLRYGKFLGNESDAEEHDHSDNDHDGAGDIGNAQKMIDEVSHKHDNAEDATFFDAQTKKQLKATLDEMWKAELQLRTYHPKDALPFEYKALKLLKDLQQQTRVFVAKTGSKTPPLKPEKRLTGELDKIIEPVQQKNYPSSPDELLLLRKAIGVLEQLKNKETIDAAASTTMHEASGQLAVKAAAEPATYLAAYEAMGRINKNTFNHTDLLLAGRALQKMINQVPQLPQQQNSGTYGKLAEQYFINLNRPHE